MLAVVAVLASYVIGSIPWAYLAGRWLKGVDLRTYGSGNLGTTNVLRLLGAPAAIIVYALDAAKGFLPVLLFPAIFNFAPHGGWAIACGMAAIMGHVKPLFLLFNGGGKGVATASGVFFALTPLATFASLAFFLLLLFTTRTMSLASLTGAAVLPIGVALTHGVKSLVFGVALGVAAFVYWTHRANIGRLRRGEEPKLSFRRTPKDAGAVDGLSPQGRA
ncbi:MAG TPA: glycerol-3-phosphate 1-O-acyltransferase PlsY [Gemmatimonadaceae bacterium]|nr:glycerol-3-phosphate 1-O-acyltransferase PlsY [Gemmatimonadaceae bacterium]